MGDLTGENSRERVLALLRQDTTRNWGCKEVADVLGLTVRTVSATIASLKSENLIERAYGARRRMLFRACESPLPMFPAWMTGGVPRIEHLVTGSRVNLIDKGEVDIKTLTEMRQFAASVWCKLQKSKYEKVVIYLDTDARAYRHTYDTDIADTDVPVAGIYGKAASTEEMVDDMAELMDDVYG